ncbi:MAG: FAD-dependent oxidoreductase [Candidatus Hydrothermarchaeales archaeon]
MHDQKLVYDILIIGGGVSGFAAAMYAGRFQMKTLVIGETTGGTIILTDLVENYPGFKKLTGMELADKIKEHALAYDVDLLEDKVTKVAKCKEGCYRIMTSKQSFHTKTLIFATGTEWRKLGVPGEKEFANKGVHYCALCDGPFYKGKTIGIVGGSDSAAKEALLLANYGEKVYIIYRGEKIRPEPVNKRRVEENPKIEVINNTNVLEIHGDEFVRKVIFDKPYKGSTEFILDALFIEIGHIPLSQLAKDIGVETNQKGEIIIDRESKTNLPGAFAAGDVVDTIFKQAITGVAEGVIAAYNAYQYINESEIICTCDDEEIEASK